MKLNKKIKFREDPILRVNVEKKGEFAFPTFPRLSQTFQPILESFLQSPTSGAYVEGFWLRRMSERLDR
jgi:hypothetical protein